MEALLTEVNRERSKEKEMYCYAQQIISLFFHFPHPAAPTTEPFHLDSRREVEDKGNRRDQGRKKKWKDIDIRRIALIGVGPPRFGYSVWFSLVLNQC